ncbi:hypothetical protein OIDMADRAFT_119851 [Oidiodendron maius Zn]|uniref:Zn(2)-C6 fungal-type domain-containing protein n=1 Tax=Oidiodendron maius (strain Zn) TaxID=913774 RepID=A0A0C3H4U8_OIDMZ|nr:hypothetical protein OIDMADRAFT_119851 [Oidiodendron maius Zn]
MEEATASQGQPEISACKSCRNRKLKCSRELPSCSQCCRLSSPCVYDRSKHKRGLKSGAVESLSRRISPPLTLILDNSALTKSNANESRPPSPVHRQGCLYHAALLIAKSASDNTDCSDGLRHGAALLNCNFDGVPSALSSNSLHATPASNSTKRRRTNDWNNEVGDLAMQLPPNHVLDAIFKAYFKNIHPWLPCVHQNTFEARLIHPEEAKKLSVVIHAMICAAMKHLRLENIQIEEDERDRQVQVSRDAVIRMAMTSMSMSEGNLASAWPIIGSLTRTVEYLQLSIEVDEQPQQGFLRAVTILEDSASWAEAEERRRVFWNVFILDRLCSSMTGWNTSLTSEDVRRRLPSDGKIWARGERAITPYFGIWNKSAAKIGNPISHCQEQRSPLSPDSMATNRNDTSPASESSNVGSFAYRIEATESLSQLISYFLRQPINFLNRQEVGSWLTRFKELDLRLVHWKAFLPPKFKDSDTSPDHTVVTMDPNLTLAHVTHNASMILLHQHIAYPPVELQNIVRLPSSCSAETCQLAAIETSSISQKFLTHTEFEIVVAQFPFCAFIAARVLLATGNSLDNEFFILLKSLRDMSRRWQGLPSTPPHQAGIDNNKEHLDLAAQYTCLLEAIHAKILNDPGLIPEVVGRNRVPDQAFNLSSQNTDSETRNIYSPPSPGSKSPVYSLLGKRATPGLMSATPPPLTEPRHARASMTQELMLDPINNGDISVGNGMNELTEDELTAMSDGLLDQSFLELDRVITLDGTDFNFDISYWGRNEFV